MNKHLQDLVQLSQVDNDIDSFDSKVETAKSKLNLIIEEKTNLENRISELEENIKEDKVKKSRNDLHLSELNDKLSKISDKTKSIKTDRELKALNLEEEIAKEQINFANEEIERLDRAIEIATENISQVKSELEGAISAEQAELANVEGELQTIENEKKVAYKNKEELISKMDQKLIPFYEKIKRWAGNTTVVPVKKQACYGCYMKLNDRTYSDVVKSEEIISCPHCGRILYYIQEDQA